MVTINMIASYLNDCSLEFISPDRSKRFSHVGLLDNMTSTSDGELNLLQTPATPDTLYCGGPDEVASFMIDQTDAWCLCVLRKEDPFDTCNAPHSHIVFCHSNKKPTEILVRLQKLFFTINSWVQQMKTVLLQGGTYQSLLNCSERILGNFISISNSEFRLLAYTQSIPSDDPVSQEFVRLGYHPSEVIERFRKNGVVREWETQNRIKIKPTGITAHPTIDYVFRMKGSYFLHAVMQCNNVDPSPALVDAFQLLLEHIDYCVKRDWNERFHVASEPSRLFGDLIAHRPIQDRDLTQRLESVGLERRGDFLLLAFLFTGSSCENQLFNYYADHVKQTFPEYHVGINSTYVLALSANVDFPEKHEARLRTYANAHSCTIGVSEPFDNIEGLAFAFEQTRNAIRIVTNPNPSIALSFEKDKAGSPISRFRDCFASYVAETARLSNYLIGHCAQNGIIHRIARYDEQHNTSDLKILYFFLKNERKVSATRQELCMQRSTLLYRIEKLQERFGFDLDDANTRARIMMEYLLYLA
mgnify:FL=1